LLRETALTLGTDARAPQRAVGTPVNEKGAGTNASPLDHVGYQMRISAPSRLGIYPPVTPFASERLSEA
jgi:hypothetical protein